MSRTVFSIDWETFVNMKERISELEAQVRQVEKEQDTNSVLWLKHHALLNRLEAARDMVDESIADSCLRNRLKGVLTV